MRTKSISVITGAEAFDKKFKEKIENILAANKDLGLRGYVNFLHSSSYTTRSAYLGYAVNFLRYINKKKEDLCLDDYTEYIASLDEKTASYQIAIYSALKKLSAYMVATGIASVDYMKYVPRPKFTESQKTKEKREHAYLTEDELQKYMDNVKKGTGNEIALARQKEWRNRDMLMTQIFLTTGMRCSALYRLDIDSLDFQNGTLATIDKGGDVQLHYLAPSVIETAKKWIADRAEKGVPDEERALFISNQRRRMHVNSIANIVEKYAAGIKDSGFSPHKLRATYGTQLYNATNDIYLVQQCMGHSNPKTSELYVRGQKNVSREKASGIMENLIR